MEPIYIIADTQRAVSRDKIYVTQNDNVKLIVKIQQNGKDVPLTVDNTYTLTSLRRDGISVMSPTAGVLTGSNEIVFEVGTQALIIAGKVRASVQILSPSGRISTLSFEFNVVDDISTDFITSENEQTLIEMVLYEAPAIIQAAKDSVADSELAVANANVAVAEVGAVAAENKTRFLNAVATIALRDSTYPTPLHGDTVRVTSEAKTYRFVTGSGWVVTDEYNATAIDNVTAQLAEKADEDSVIGKKKEISEGLMPVPLRVPSLGVERMYPNTREPYTPLLISGDTIYAYGRDQTLRKTVDGGKTWTKRGNNNRGFNAYGCFLKTSTGNLLSIAAISGGSPIIQLSTDDGATWNTVFTFRQYTIPLGTQSWAIDKNNGWIYMAEYNTQATIDIMIWVSKDHGATWQTFKTFKGQLETGTERIRHFHAVQWDEYAKRIVFCAGDVTDWTGLWRVNATNDDVEKIITLDLLPENSGVTPRSIGIVPFPNYIVWGADQPELPYIYRMHRSQIGVQNPAVERVYRLNSSIWYSCKASNDGSRWVVSSGTESPSIDKMVHLYAIEDEGATVWEIGVIPPPTGVGTALLMPMNEAETHGDVFHMHTMGFPNVVVWKFKIGSGFASIPKPEPIPETLFTQTLATSGVISLAGGEEKVFGISHAGTLGRNLRIFEASLAVTNRNGSAAGSQRLWIRKEGQGTNYLKQYLSSSERNSTLQDLGTEIDYVLLNSNDRIEFVVKNMAAETVQLYSSVTFSWGRA